MHRHLRTTFILLAIASLSACRRMPDHARYIPKDAVVATGINLKALGKKIAWNVITGSKLFKEMQKRLPDKTGKEAVSRIEKAGIDAMNTFFIYVKTGENGANRITGLIPLSDAAQWEAYVKDVFPQAQVKQHGDRKEASLGRDMYVGWNKNLLIIINIMSVSADYETESNTEAPKLNVSSSMGQADLSAEMDKAFGVTKDNSIVGNSRFTALEMEGHDITFWLNYEQLMTQMSSNMAEKTGVTLSNSLWKESVATAGFDFKKGKISADVRYFLPDELKEVGKEFGAANADQDMVQRLPNQNLDMLVALHFSPKGFKSMMEKTGYLGLANVALGTQNMNVDEILDAFTGDMAITMNNFALHTESARDSFMGQMVVHQNQKPSMEMSYVIKINKKEKFQKLVQMARDNGLQPVNNGFVIPIDDKDSIYILMNDQFVVASNKYNNAAGFLQGTFKAQKLPDALNQQVLSHPIVVYFDIQQVFKKIDPSVATSPHDSAMIAESGKLLNNVYLTGGDFKDNAFEYHLDVNFTNTEENSLIALMDYGMRMSEANDVKQ
jgi:hypothetical protein